MYHYFKHVFMSALLVTAASCANNGSGEDIIDKTDFKSADGVFDIDALEALGRVSARWCRLMARKCCMVYLTKM